MRFSLKSPLGRVREAAWPITQAALAAGVSWILAQMALGHAQPVFAPSAAVVALAASVGGRGTQAAEMLLGVAVGALVGEGLVLFLGTGAPQVTLASGAAMLAMALARTSPLPLIQAGSSAVLVVALRSPESGTERMLDALVGGAVALIVSQVLFPPSPVSMLKTAVGETLGALSDGLYRSAQALQTGDDDAARAALQSLRAQERRTMPSLDAAREKSGKVARRTLRGRLETERFRYLDDRMENLDTLSASVLVLSRATYRLLDERVAPPDWLPPALQNLARALEALADDPESPDVRRRAADAAAEARGQAARGEASGTPNPRVALAAEGVRLAASDVDELAEPKTAPAARGE